MELHGLNRQIAMPHAHHDAVFGFRRDFEASRETFRDWRRASDNVPRETAKANCETRLGLAWCTNDAFAVHRVGQHIQHSAKCFHNAL